MKTRDRLFAAGSAVVITGLVLAAHSQEASAAPAATPTARTCAAFQTWNHHRTTANLDAMMTASFAAPWKYIGQDASDLYADVRGNATKYVAKDITYFGQDCKA